MQTTKLKKLLPTYYETFHHFTKLSKVQYVLHKTKNQSTELTEDFIRKLRNPMKCAEIKTVPYENFEIIVFLLNLKSFGTKIWNF